jgi:hypothetical protein
VGHSQDGFECVTVTSDQNLTQFAADPPDPFTGLNPIKVCELNPELDCTSGESLKGCSIRVQSDDHCVAKAGTWVCSRPQPAGATLKSVAASSQSLVRNATLLKSHNLDILWGGDRIWPNMRLRLPSPECIEDKDYDCITVQQGDTLASLATTWKSSVEQMVQMNAETLGPDSQTVVPRMQLRIPPWDDDPVIQAAPVPCVEVPGEYASACVFSYVSLTPAFSVGLNCTKGQWTCMTLQPGESLYTALGGITGQNLTSWEGVARLNGIKDVDNMQPGVPFAVPADELLQRCMDNVFACPSIPQRKTGHSPQTYMCGGYGAFSWYYRVPQTTRLNVRLSRFDALDDNQRPTCKCTSRCCKNYIASYPRNKNCACGAVAYGNRVYRYSKVQLGCVPDVSFHYFVFANFCFALR